MEEIYTIDQIREIQKEQKYKFIGMHNANGKEVIKQNAAKVTPEDKLDVIETRLKAPRFKEGYYVVLCRHHHSSQPDEYTIVKGNPKTLKEEPAPPPQPPPLAIGKDEVLSYDEALRMHREISDLMNTNAVLEDKLAKAEEDLEEADELIAEYEEDAQTLGDNSSNLGTMIKETVTALIPVVDRHFDLKEGEQQLLKAKMIQELQGAPSNGAPPNAQPQPENTEHRILTEEEEDQLEDEQFYQYRNWLLMHYYNNDQEAYATLLKRIEQERKHNAEAK